MDGRGYNLIIMKTKYFDLTATIAGAPIQTRAGEPAQFVGHFPNNKSNHRVVYIVNGEMLRANEMGCYDGFPDSKDDLIMAPETHTFWLNVYHNKLFPNDLAVSKFPNKIVADMHAGINRIACVEIKVEEGQGL